MNLPILYQNIMFGLPSNLARDAFLWAVEQPNEDRYCYRAEKFAEEVHQLVQVLTPMFTSSANILGLDAIPEGLLNFVLTRHANWRYGGNKKITYGDHKKECDE